MMEAHVLQCGPFRIDLRNECVWHGAQALRLRPKSFAVLRYLVTHSGRLVTKEELLAAVWPATVVREAALAICIGQLRRLLGDTPRTPQFIATVPRRGYRFIAALTPADLPVAQPDATTDADRRPLAALPDGFRAPLLVGREREVQCLHGWLEQAWGGVRQMVFVTGEPGIGKTAVVEAFAASLAAEANLTVAWGQCLDHHGMGEAYLPVLDALGRLCVGADNGQLLDLLARYAPTWLRHMPARRGAEAAVPHQGLNTSRERMLREFAEAAEAFTVDRLLVLVLEDLHWSDHATLDLLAWLARRRWPARLLLLGTYRPVEVIVRGHPLQSIHRDLVLHGQCADLRLEGLTEAEVATYMAARFPSSPLLPRLASVLYRRTDGHPLFMVQTVEAWLRQGWVTEVDGQWVVTVAPADLEMGVAESLRQMIEEQFDRCSPADQQLLEAASVVGAEFSVAAVAAGLATVTTEVEERSATLARRGLFVQACGVEAWPDGTVAERYGFLHTWYQQVIYDRLPGGRRAQLHRQIGAWEAAAYGGQEREHAAQVAMHFDRGREYGRAAPFRQWAAEQALQRYAYHEAIGHLRRGLAGLQTLPATPEHVQHELVLHILLGTVLIVTQGYAAPDVERVYLRALTLCQQMGETSHLFQVLWGLSLVYLSRGALQTAHEMAEKLLAMAQNTPNLISPLQRGHNMLGTTLFWQGEFVSARMHVEHTLALDETLQPDAHAFFYVQEARVVAYRQLSCNLWFLGYPDQALFQSGAALTAARVLGHPHSLAVALHFAAWLHQLRGEVRAMHERVEELATLASTEGFALWAALATIWSGWIAAVQGRPAEGIAQIRQGLTARDATGARMPQATNLALLVEAYGKAGQVAEGLRLVAEALVTADTTGERVYEAELHRLQGELLLHQEPPDAVQAERCFQQALAIARHQQARSLELRASISLSRLWQRWGKCTEASTMLAEVYGWFSEGFDTVDLQEAKALLQALAQESGFRPTK